VAILFLELRVHVDGVGYVAFTLVHGDPGIWREILEWVKETCCVAGRIMVDLVSDCIERNVP
jgi:hypothetical protein